MFEDQWIKISSCSKENIVANNRLRVLTYYQLCAGFQVRIVPDDPVAKSHGFVEVKINGIWGSVCGTGFTDRTANIVCKQKGFRGGVAYTPGTTNPFYTRTQTIVKETSPILMTEVHCTGNETSLGKCSYKATSKTTWCDYYAPRAGVLCYSRDSK